MDTSHKAKDIFHQGPIPAAMVAESLQKHSSRTDIGAHSMFLGQVRSDVLGGQTVRAIEYTTYADMALEQMQEIRDSIFAKYPLTCLHVHHSLGIVKAGEISLFVFASSIHRRAAIDACNEVVEAIKNTLPVWGKELFDNNDSSWKVNR
jgi:molybdopterin synthase catalytic subunit